MYPSEITDNVSCDGDIRWMNISRLTKEIPKEINGLDIDGIVEYRSKYAPDKSLHWFKYMIDVISYYFSPSRSLRVNYADELLEKISSEM